MTQPKRILTAGFAIFSMFFGSGNLVFPIDIGKTALGGYGWGVLGLLLSGIGMPLLGMLSVLLYGSDTRVYMQRLGRWPALALMFIMLSLMGPFGVGARCLLVAHGGVALMWPALPLLPFAVVFGALATVFAYKGRMVVEGLGRVLTPFLLLGIAALIVFGLRQAPAVLPAPQPAWELFKSAFLTGYELMDLLAAFFFSATILSYFAEDQADPKKTFLHGLAACLVGATLLALVYVGFVALGAHYAPELAHCPQQSYVPAIAKLCLGAWALPIASVTIALACLTTLIVLIRLFATFLQRDLSGNRLPNEAALLITLACTILTARIGFTTLTAFLGQALTLAYPALVAFAIASIIDRFYRSKLSTWAFWLVLVGALGVDAASWK